MNEKTESPVDPKVKAEEARLMELDHPAHLLAEWSLLGAIMICADPNSLPKWLKPEDFVEERNRMIYAAILKLRDEKRGIDLCTVCNELDRRGLLAKCGGIAYVSGLVDRVPITDHLPYYAEDVKDASRRRTLARLEKFGRGL